MTATHPALEEVARGGFWGVDQRGLRFRNLRAPSSNNHGAPDCKSMSIRWAISSSLNSGSPHNSRMRLGETSHSAIAHASVTACLMCGAPGRGRWLGGLGLTVVGGIGALMMAGLRVAVMARETGHRCSRRVVVL